MAKARRTREDNGTTNSTAEPHDNGNPQDRIAARAYELYLARGGSHGQDWDDWLAAEREVSSTQPRTDRTE